MNCSICRHPQAAEMIIDYAYTCSLRVTASRFNVGYRSLQRHIERCVYALMEEAEQQEYEQKLSSVAEDLRFYFEYKMRPRRKESIITKKVNFTWSRRAWKQ
jgi:hypothetical protein